VIQSIYQLVRRRPNIDQAARDALEDLGLVDDDHTEDLSAVLIEGEGAPAPQCD
jgi:hypothetical protein